MKARACILKHQILLIPNCSPAKSPCCKVSFTGNMSMNFACQDRTSGKSTNSKDTVYNGSLQVKVQKEGFETISLLFRNIFDK